MRSAAASGRLRQSARRQTLLRWTDPTRARRRGAAPAQLSPEQRKRRRNSSRARTLSSSVFGTGKLEIGREEIPRPAPEKIGATHERAKLSPAPRCALAADTDYSTVLDGAPRPPPPAAAELSSRCRETTPSPVVGRHTAAARATARRSHSRPNPRFGASDLRHRPPSQRTCCAQRSRQPPQLDASAAAAGGAPFNRGRRLRRQTEAAGSAGGMSGRVPTSRDVAEARRRGVRAAVDQEQRIADASLVPRQGARARSAARRGVGAL